MPYGLALTGQKLVFNASETLPLIAIGSIYGFAEVAIFQVAFFVYSSVGGYVGALIAMYLPRFFSGTRLEKRKMITHNLFSGVIIVIGMGLFLVFVSPFLFDERYSESIRVAWFLLPVMLLLPLKSYLTSYFTASNRVVLLITVYIFANAAAGLVFWLFRSHGAGIAGVLYVSVLVLSSTLSISVSYFSEVASRKTDSI